MSLYVFWLRREPSIKYVYNCRGMGGWGHPKYVQLRTGVRVSILMCTYALTLSLLAALLSYNVLFGTRCLHKMFKDNRKHFKTNSSTRIVMCTNCLIISYILQSFPSKRGISATEMHYPK